MSRSSPQPAVVAVPVLVPQGRGGKRKFVTELPPQGTIDQVFLATQKQLRPNRNGQLYLQVELADRTGSVTARMWNAGDAEFSAFEEGEYVRVEGSTQVYQGNVQMIATSIQRVDPRGIDEANLRARKAFPTPIRASCSAMCCWGWKSSTSTSPWWSRNGASRFIVSWLFA
ncbi:hypothetical protein EBU58_04385 [bacterium]|nr:hypothetical protein [bacterium]